MLQFFSDQNYNKIWFMVTGDGLPMNYYPTMWRVLPQRNEFVKIICRFASISKMVVVQRENSRSQWVFPGQDTSELAYLLRRYCTGKQVKFELDK